MKRKPQYELTEIALQYLRPSAGFAPWVKTTFDQSDNGRVSYDLTKRQRQVA